MSKSCRVSVTLFLVLLTAGMFLSCGESEPPAPPAAPAPAAPPAESVQPFLRLVEADAFFYLGMRDWKGLEIFDFIQTARRLRIVPRFKKFMDPGLGEFPERPGAERRLRELASLREKVSLRELLGGEFALVAYPGKPGEPPVPALIIRLPEGKAEIYTEYFRQLAELSRTGGEAGAETEGDFLGLPVYTFPLPGGMARAAWCRSGDILVAAAARGRVEGIVSRLLGRGEGPSLAEDEAFRGSFRDLDAGSRGVFYLDIRPLTEVIAAAIRKERPDLDFPGFSASEKGGGRFYLRGLRKALRTVERIAGTFDFSPEAYREEVRFYLDETQGSRALLDLVKTPPRSWEVLNYIPAAAADISAGFLDPKKAYRLLIDFLAAGSTEGRKIRDRWEEKQAAAGLRVEEDVLSWLGDEFAFSTLSLPRSIFDPGAWAIFLRFTSAADLDRFLVSLAGRAREANLNVVAEEYGGFAFNVLYLPIPLFPVTPAAGRVGEFLVLASRKDIFTGIVDTYNGQEPSIRQNPDFRRLEAELGSEGSAIFFSRLEDKIEALISTIRSSASMVALLLPPPGAEGEEENTVAPDSREVIDFLNDFTRVLEDFKVFRFRAGISLYRDGYIQSRSVVEIGR